jgi:hypothetical protein
MKCPYRTVVFVFVPFDSARQDFDARLRECLASLEPSKPTEETVLPEPKRPDETAWPFWTWFLPNPCPAGKKHLRFWLNLPRNRLN